MNEKNCKKVYLHSFGCKVNQYETQLLREGIIRFGNSVVDSYENADVCVINSCTVTHKADADCRQLIRKILSANLQTKVVVAGCYAVRAPEEIVNISSRIEICPEKEEILALLCPSLITHQSLLITNFDGHTRAFVKIQDGCDAFCSFCIVPYVRAKLVSRIPEEIIAEIKCLVKNGYKEIVLTGIRLGKYQALGTRHEARGWEDERYDLVGLLKDLERIDGLYRIRLSSIEINEITDDLLELMVNSKKICPHLHIPLQSGDNEILKLMNRTYQTEEYAEKIYQARSYLPEVGITTDVMAGFPGEKEENFLRSYEFVKWIEFSGLHVFPYSLRPGTKAAEFKFQVSPKIKKIRTQKFLELGYYLRKRFKEKFINQEMDVLLDKKEKDFFSGFTPNGIRIKVNPAPHRCGVNWGRKNEIARIKIN